MNIWRVLISYLLLAALAVISVVDIALALSGRGGESDWLVSVGTAAAVAGVIAAALLAYGTAKGHLRIFNAGSVALISGLAGFVLKTMGASLGTSATHSLAYAIPVTLGSVAVVSYILACFRPAAIQAAARADLGA